jgi:hypothetical protein
MLRTSVKVGQSAPSYYLEMRHSQPFDLAKVQPQNSETLAGSRLVRPRFHSSHFADPDRSLKAEIQHRLSRDSHAFPACQPLRAGPGGRAR